MKSHAKEIARFALLTALALVLGLVDRAVPLTALLSGAVPGVKLGLANTVLLYGVCLMDWRACILLMLTKVFLSGFLFGSMSAILYSLSGGALSLAAMLLIRRGGRKGALAVALLAGLSEAALLWRHPAPGGPMLVCALLVTLGCVAALAAWVASRRVRDWDVVGTSMAGAVAHNVGQVLAASAVLRAPQLLWTYLPLLVGIGAAVGGLTGLVARRVFRALNRAA